MAAAPVAWSCGRWYRRVCPPDSESARAPDGCGNGAPMEITERFPQPLGNLAKNARFPHSHSRLSDLDHEEQRQQTRTAIRSRVTSFKEG
jgi:hypothetical protein